MKKYLIILLFGFTMLLLFGCINLSTKYIEQQKYAISISSPAKVYCGASVKKQKMRYKILEIDHPAIASQFAASNFVYRVNDLEYTNDFYNLFFAPPDVQISQNIVKYFQAAKLFKFVSDDVAPLKTDYILRSNITELYADYREKNAPKAVISMQFVLLDVTKDKPKIVMDKSFHESILLKEKSSAALVYGWDKGLQNILHRFTNVACLRVHG